MQDQLISFLIIFVIFLVSALPLHLAVVILGGRTYILKTMFVMLISGLITSLIALLFPYGALIAFVVLIWIYREMFRLRWLKALIAWFLQLVFFAIMGVLLALLGLSAYTFSFFV